MKVVHRQWLFVVFCLAATLFSYSLFLICYFPLKQGLVGYASPTEVPPEPYSGREGIPDPHYSRLVLMVIDAVRTDFVLGDTAYMPFTRQLLGNGHGVSFSAKTHLPTVTLPRLKVILNNESETDVRAECSLSAFFSLFAFPSSFEGVDDLKSLDIIYMDATTVMHSWRKEKQNNI